MFIVSKKEAFYGGCGEVVNAPDCGSGIRGFDSHQSPHLLGYGQEVKASDFDSDTGGSNPPSPAILFAGVAELADALDLGSSSSECRFDSCHPHQNGKQHDISGYYVFFAETSIIMVLFLDVIVL